MHNVIAKTFGGLSASYYFRHVLFGMIFPIFILAMLSEGKHPLQMPTLIFFAVNTLLYPYSRFVYESIMDFITGKNLFFVNALLMIAVKLMTMFICWIGAVFVAPFGLAYLYYHHSKASD